MTESQPAISPPRRVLRGSIVELSAHGIQQAVRLGSNLITTRLLFPAAFGASSVVWALATALVMFSDVALSPMIVQSKRGEDPAFLNTAFTVQAVRGVGLCLLMILLSKPVGGFYRDPSLPPLICLGALQLLIGGFHSTSIYTLRRRLHLGWLNAFDLAQTIFITALSISLAWIYGKAWTLILGSVLGFFVFTVLSHFLPVPYRNRFQWEKPALQEIRHFSRWILGSSVASFFGGQADRIALGRFLGTAWLGVYGVAITISDAIGGAISRLINGVMFPVLTEAARAPNAHIGYQYYRLRTRVDLLAMGATGVMAGAGGWLVRLLWDSRYADAAWMLQIVAVRVGVAALVSSAETSLLALGLTRYVFQRSVARLVATLVFLPLGWAIGGVRGLIWGSVAAEGTALIAVWPKSHNLGILRIRRELFAAGIFGVSYGVARLALPLLPILHLR